jgi:hypothetical protein
MSTTPRFTGFVLAILAAAVALPFTAVPALAQEDKSDKDALVVLTGRATVAEGETVDTVVIFDGPAVVEGTVREGVFAFNGPVTVSGRVGEDVVAFNGQVTLESGAEVGGDVSARKGVDDQGATVGGDVRRNVTRFFDRPFTRFVGRFVIWLAASVSILLLGVFLILLVPRALDALHDTWRTAIGSSIGWGLLLFIGLPLLAILSLVTLLGIPFGVGLLLALFAVYAIGYTVTTWILGRRLVKPPASRFLAFMAGWAILRLVALVPILAGIAWFVAVIFGLGALLITAWRARRGGVVPEAASIPGG